MADAPTTSLSGPLNIGDPFLRFEIRGLLGKGGHAWVYHGYDAFLDRHVAIKIIPNPGEPSRDLRERAQYEARVLYKIADPNVVRISEAGWTNDSAVYIVMELLHGRTLREAIQAYIQLSVIEVLTLAQKIASGTHAAHLAGAIHRDLKPENVFLVEDNGVKVLDFGIAKLFGFGAATTQRDVLHGTMMYMSPEHLQGLRVTERTDIYALGTMLYEALSGQVPCIIGIQEPSLNALIYAQINRMPPLVDELVPSVPHFMARTIQRMLAKDADERFATMAEVAEIFRAHEARYLEESRHSAPTSRQLWLAPQASVPSNAPFFSHTATDNYQFSNVAATTAPPVSLPTSPPGMAAARAPVSKLPISEPRARTANSHALATEPLRVVVAPSVRSPLVSSAQAVQSIDPAPRLAPALTPHTEVRAPLSRAASRPGPGATQPAPSAHRDVAPSEPDSSAVIHQVGTYPVQTAASARKAVSRQKASSPRLGAIALQDIVSIALLAGMAIGLGVGLVAYWPKATVITPTTSSSREQPVVVVSSQVPTHAEPPAPVPEAASNVFAAAPGNPSPATAAVPAAAVPAAVSEATPIRPPSKPLAAAPAPAPVAPPAPAVRAVARVAPKSAAAVPTGGLWDMSDLEAPAKPKSGPATPPKPRNVAVY